MKQLNAVILTALLALSGCTLYLAPPGVQVHITVPSNARALTADKISWELSGDGPDGAVLEAVSLSSGTNTIEDLVPGTWTLKLTGKDEASDSVSQGETTVELQPGANDVTMTMVSLDLKASSGKGPNDGVLIISGQVYTDSTKVNTPPTSPTNYEIGSTLTNGLIRATNNGGYWLEIQAFSDPELQYSWVLNGDVIAGETGATLGRAVTTFLMKLNVLTLTVTDETGKVFSENITVDVKSAG